jgi:hypothetical protein
VSVTLFTDCDGGTDWWITKESGRPPVLGVGCTTHAGCGKEDLRGSYAIHKRGLPRHPYVAVFIAELTMQSLRFLHHVAGVDLAREMWYVGYEADMDMVFMERYFNIARSVCRGAYASIEGCSCTSVGAVECGTVCSRCASSFPNRSGFVEQNRFLGVFPHSERAWFGGVTDGIDNGEQPWWMRYGYNGVLKDGGMEMIPCLDGCLWG